MEDLTNSVKPFNCIEERNIKDTLNKNTVKYREEKTKKKYKKLIDYVFIIIFRQNHM